VGFEKYPIFIMKIESLDFVSNPMVSVVLCAMNREKTIAQTIDCILAQQCNFPFELIIGEDCGSDNTRNICIEYQKKYPEKIKLILHKENCGLGKNWAILVREAKGKYVASCDDDDYWHNLSKLQIQVDYLDSHPACGVVHTEKDELDVRNNHLTVNYYKSKHIHIPQGFIMKEIFSGKALICVSTSMFRKELVDRYVPLDDYIRFRYNIQDWQTWVILAKYCEINYLPVSTTTYRVGYESISNPLQYEKIEERFTKEQLMYKYLCDRFPEDLAYSENGYTSYVKGILLSVAYKKSDFGAAKKYAQQLKVLGSNSLKIKMAQQKLTFKAFTMIKLLLRKLKP